MTRAERRLQRRRTIGCNQLSAFDRSIDQCIRTSFTDELPDRLYHYTPNNDGLEGIIRTGNIRAKYFADFDAKHGSELAEADPTILDAAKALAETYHGKLAQNVLSIFVDQYARLKISNHDEFKIYLACFCEEGEQEPLWRKFAANGEGYCLGFTLTKERNDTQFASAGLGRVQYEPSEVSSSTKKALEPIVQRLEGLHVRSSSDIARAHRIALSGLYRSAAFACIRTKAVRFSDEREYRLAIFDQTAPVFERNGVHYLDWPLRNQGKLPLLASVHVGARHGAQEVERVRSMLQGAGYGAASDLPMPELLLSKVIV